MSVKAKLVRANAKVITTPNGGSYVKTVDAILDPTDRAMLERHRQMWRNSKQLLTVRGKRIDRIAIAVKSK